MKTFRKKVIECVKSIPRGKVASYGQVAAWCGSPRAARVVGGILRSLDIAENILRGPQISHSANRRGNLGRGAKSRRSERAKNLSHVETAETIVPWWRIINSQGVISIKGNWIATKEMQAELLRREGVVVEKNCNVNMEKFRFKKRP